MNQMAMGQMNQMGGPVGGMPMMNNANGNGADATPRSDSDLPEGTLKKQLNTYIYEYFIAQGYPDCARSILNAGPPLLLKDKQSPGQRRNGDMNGINDHAMDADSKDDPNSKRPADLPLPFMDGADNFLVDWFALFWDFYSAQRKPKNEPAAGSTMQYLQYNQVWWSELLYRCSVISNKIRIGNAYARATTAGVSARSRAADDAWPDADEHDVPGPERSHAQ